MSTAKGIKVKYPTQWPAPPEAPSTKAAAPAKKASGGAVAPSPHCPLTVAAMHDPVHRLASIGVVVGNSVKEPKDGQC